MMCVSSVMRGQDPGRQIGQFAANTHAIACLNASDSAHLTVTLTCVHGPDVQQCARDPPRVGAPMRLS